MENKKAILIISPESWSHIFVSKHHYAIELAKRGHKVFFLNPPDTSKNDLRLHQWAENPNIIIVDYPGQIAGLRLLPIFLRIWFHRRFLDRLEKKSGIPIDVVWNFENSRFYDLHFAGNRLKIYHQVDLNQNFHVRNTAVSADICFCTTDFIKQRIEPYNQKVFKIHHGVSAEAFLGSDLYKSHFSLTNKSLKATMIGNLDSGLLDISLLVRLVSINPMLEFVFVGNYTNTSPIYLQFSGFKNVSFVEKVKSENIKYLLTVSDILMVCYNANKYNQQLASPHKFMEYFASGVVVVATYTDEYKDKRNLLVMAESNSEYIDCFNMVVNNIKFYNSEDKRLERVAFAKAHTYGKQLDKISDLIKVHAGTTLS